MPTTRRISSARSGAAATPSIWTRLKPFWIAAAAVLTVAASTVPVVPPPVIPADNPQSPAKIELGRRLFYDQRLSVTGSYSCASCHQSARAFSDGRSLGIGATGETHMRNVPSLANVVYRPVLTWADPQLRHLEEQLLVPLLGNHPIELGAVETKIKGLLDEDAEYRRLFAAAFDGERSVVNVARAIAAFERTLISFHSPWDRYRAGESSAISPAAKRGEALFFGDRLQCFRCHMAPHFTDTYVSSDLPFAEIAFHDIGLADPTMTRVRAPSLRNVAVTAPYMHDGSVTSLGEVLDIYAAGGQGDGKSRPTKSVYVRGFTLSDAEKQDVIAFLESLTDEAFLTDPRLSDPFAADPPAGR